MLLEWPVIAMDQQFRMVSGLFDPARDIFSSHDSIVDGLHPGADRTIADPSERWAQAKSASAPPDDKQWPVFVDIPGSRCQKIDDSQLLA